MDDERLKKIEEQRQAALNENNNVYSSILQDNENLYNMNKNYATQYQTTQDEMLQKQLENNLKKIEQQKQEAQNQYEGESIKAKNSYEAYTNPYSAQNEKLAASGLSNSGLAETSKLGAYTAYQNRVSNANKALQSAFTQYNLAMDDARLNNDVQKAQNALKALEMNIDFANSFYSNKATYSINQLNTNRDTGNDYYNRYMDAINQINYEKEQAEKIRQYNEQFAYQKQRDKVADNQWEKEYALSKKKVGSSGNSYIGSLGNNYSELSNSLEGTIVNGRTIVANPTTNTVNPDTQYGVFEHGNSGSGFQPDNISGSKLSKSGYKVKNIFDGSGNHANQNVWKTNGKYYVWDDLLNNYIDVTDQASKIIDKGYKVSYQWGK